MRHEFAVLVAVDEELDADRRGGGGRGGGRGELDADGDVEVGGDGEGEVGQVEVHAGEAAAVGGGGGRGGRGGAGDEGRLVGVAGEVPALAFGEETAFVHGAAERVEGRGSEGAAGVALNAPGCEVCG